MADKLIYRIPGEAIVEQNGTFSLQDKVSKISGFVVSDFILNAIYVFKEDQNANSKKNKLFFQRKVPKSITQNEYIFLTKQFLSVFNLFGVAKAVFSRIKKVNFDEKKTFQLFESIEKEYPKAFVYLVSSKLFGTWIGATPEILTHVQGKSGFTMSLAGTKRIIETSKWGEKEIEEQRFVTDFIFDQLTRKKYKNIELNGPYEIAAGPVKHLRTDISFDMGKKTAFQLLKLLHPTPAVSGFPQVEALGLIGAFEPHDRELYAGVIGIIGKEKTKLYVNLRCCQIKKGAAYLYLGGGFTNESDPELEWEETENKSKTLLNILQKL